MDWFDRLAQNRHIEIVILANNQGRLLRSSRPLNSDDDVLPSMLQTMEVLAQTLSSEFGCGEAHMVQISTDGGHLLLFPLANSAYYIAILTDRTAPLTLINIELERTLRDVPLVELAASETAITPSANDDSELNAEELIEAVRAWLQGRE